MTVREELHLESSVAKDWGEAGTGHWVGRVEAEGARGGGGTLPTDEH